MRFFSGTVQTLSAKDMSDLYAYRYALFIRQLGWDLPEARLNQEIDQFDRPDTIYVAVRNDRDAICGCARLLPTSEPYLLGEVFPELLDGAPIPRSRDIWEVSRFAAVDLSKKINPSAQERQFEAWLSREIFSQCVAIAVDKGAKRFITVSPIGIERLLSRMGVEFHRAAPPRPIGEHNLFACWIEINEITLAALNLEKILSIA